MIKKLLAVVGFIVVLIASAIGGLIGKEVGKSAFSSKPSEYEREAKLIEGFRTAAKQVNATLPTMIDEETRMDNVTVGPEARITYHYSFPNYSAGEIDSSWLLTNLRPDLKNNVCANSDMKPSLEYGGTYTYSYSGNDGILIVSFNLNGTDCGFADFDGGGW